MTKTALITGASAGIGEALARVFSRHKYDLILTARRTERLKRLAEQLESLHGIRISVCTADLSAPSGPSVIQQFVRENGLHVDVVVNNAGFGARGKFAELEQQKQLDMVQVNVSSLVQLSRMFLPGMLEKGDGGILNVASTAAFIPGPMMAVYYASKAFVLSFTEALADEVSGSGVHVSCLCPGATTTEFQDVAKIAKSKLFTGRLVMRADTVAEMGYDGLVNNKTVVVCGLANQMLVKTSRLAPRSITNSIARRVGEPT